MNWINKKVEKLGWLFAILAIVGVHKPSSE
jgi:hypothetical protein